MKKGLPNSLPLPNSRPKPWQDFWQCPCFFALRFGKRMQVAYTWTGVAFAWPLTQDDAGRLELTGNAFPIDPVPQNIAYLKKVLASRFLRFSFQSAMTINLQSFLVSKMCGEFMVCGGIASVVKQLAQQSCWLLVKKVA